MKTGIICYSHTGNTLSVAETLKKGLLEAGKLAVLERIEAVPDDPGAESVRVAKAPDVAPYDSLVFASPVHGFQPSKAMALYLGQLPPGSLQGKKVFCVVTHFFPFAWMGGKGSVGQMRNLCASKGAEVAGTAVIDWKNPRRNQEITALTEIIVGLF